MKDYDIIKLNPSYDATDTGDSSFGRLVPFGTRFVVVETNASWRSRRDAYYAERRAWWANDPRNCKEGRKYAIRETLYRYYLVPRAKAKQQLIRITGHVREQ